MYKETAKVLNNNPFFLYNYASELYLINEIDLSTKIASRCYDLLANYDLELLLGNLYMDRKEYDKAEFHYYKAHYMCPCRFIPLNQIYDLYIEKGEINKSLIIATEIINKPIKVESLVIAQIKYKMFNAIKNNAYEIKTMQQNK